MKPLILITALALTAGVVASEMIPPSQAHAEEEEGMALTAVLGDIKISLADAVRTAERETGGIAIEAEMDTEEGPLAFDILTVSRDGLTFIEVEVDAKTGGILNVENEGMDDDDDEDEGEDADEAGDVDEVDDSDEGDDDDDEGEEDDD